MILRKNRPVSSLILGKKGSKRVVEMENVKRKFLGFFLTILNLHSLNHFEIRDTGLVTCVCVYIYTEQFKFYFVHFKKFHFCLKPFLLLRR